jgi:hypothetical protein
VSEQKSNEPDIKSVLERGKLAFYQSLVAKVEAGSATHQELALFHKVLREAGLVYVPDADDEKGNAIAKAAAGLPDFDKSDTGDDGEG